MPDIMSWSENEVVTFCNLIGLKYNISGYGEVVSYSIPSGTIIDSSLVLNIILENKN